MEGPKPTLVLFLLYMMVVCISSYSEKQEILKYLDRNDLNIGGYKTPLKHKVAIPQHLFQRGILMSFFTEQYNEYKEFSYGFNRKDSYNVSIPCFNDIIQLFKSIGDNRTSYRNYAEKILDASAKLPSGIMEGYIFWPGSYGECVSAESPVLRSGYMISGKYCLTSFDTSLASLHRHKDTNYRYTNVNGLEMFSLNIGVCVPSRCNAEDITAIVNNVLNGTNITASTTCEAKPPFTPGTVVAFVVCGLLGLLCLVGTITDVVHVNLTQQKTSDIIHKVRRGNINYDDINENTGLLPTVSTENVALRSNEASKVSVKALQYLTVFSLVKNTRSLFSTSTPGSKSLSSVHGIRVLSIWWVMLAHTFQGVTFEPLIDNMFSAWNTVKTFWFQPIVNGWYSVDSFFLMSGLVVSVITLKKLDEKEGKINWKMFYFHRFWRLTPAYGFVLMIWVTVLYMIPPGPQLTFILGHLDLPLFNPITECTRTWWANLLYINNFYPNWGHMHKQCMKWSWYLAADMQFYLISPIIILLLHRHKKAGIAFGGFLIAASIFIRMIIAYRYGILLPSRAPTKNVDDPYAKGSPLYDKPYTRIAPYVVGMLLGYALHINNRRHRISKKIILIGWSAAVTLGVATVFGLYNSYHNDKALSLGWSIVYLGMERFTWSVAVAWVIYVCSTGNGGLVDSILSWQGWIPLGRLTYCVYLIHPIVIEHFFLSLSVRFHFTNLNMMYVFFGNLISSYLAAYAVSMAVEAPMLGLQKLVFKR